MSIANKQEAGLNALPILIYREPLQGSLIVYTPVFVGSHLS